MTHASLFSGIGGAEIAASWLGWENLFHCEINPFGRRVLEYWYPNSTSYEDITKTDFTPWRGKIDVLTGGFPCQPFSLAGQRRGAEDDRYLWPEMLRAIREIQPRWVVGENVAGILTMVQPGSEVAVGSEAALFGEADRERVLLRQEYTVETICQSLEREGYAVQPFVIPACAVGAPHRRDRVWFVAHRADTGVETLQCGREDGVHAAGVEVRHEKRVKELKEAGGDTFHSRANGETRPNGLMDYMDFHGILPTPAAQDGKKSTIPKSQTKRQQLPGVIGRNCQPPDGQDSPQLNPLFVEEMMGFPPDWLVSPFLSGEQNP